MPRIGFDLLAEPGDVDVDRACGWHGVVAPHFVEEFFAGQRGASMFDEVLQQLELARRNFERPSRLRHLRPAEVDPHLAELVALRRMRRRGRTSQFGLDACQQLHHLEGFGDVVVCAEFEADDLVDDLSPGREHDDRSFDRAFPQLLEHVETTQTRQHYVEQYEVERFAGRALQSTFPIGGDIDGIPFAGEPVAQREHEAGFVFDEEDPLRGAQAGLPCTSGIASAVEGRVAGASEADGRCTVNALPAPGVLWTTIRPPWASTIRRTRLRPRPAPWIWASITPGAR